VCDAIVADQRYPLALICGLSDVQQSRLQMLSAAGNAIAYASQMEISWDEHTAEGQGPIARCIRQGSTISLGQLQKSHDFQPWKDAALSFGLQAIVAIPLIAGPDLIGALAVYADEAHSFGPVEVQVFEELTRNVQFGIQSRRTRVAYQQSLQEQASQAQLLENALENALAAIASVLEQRDPYTAGHQKHVAELAVLIGQEMGLPQQRLRGLYLSGVVHDLGKIEVPAEILSKPSRLHPVEFAWSSATRRWVTTSCGILISLANCRHHPPAPRIPGWFRLSAGPVRGSHPAGVAHPHRGRYCRVDVIRPALSRSTGHQPGHSPDSADAWHAAGP
jgi:hypothetical protein